MNDPSQGSSVIAFENDEGGATVRVGGQAIGDDGAGDVIAKGKGKVKQEKGEKDHRRPRSRL